MTVRSLLVWLLLSCPVLADIDIVAPEKVGVGELVLVEFKPAEGQSGTWLPIEPRRLKYDVVGSKVYFSSACEPQTITLLCTVVTVSPGDPLPVVSIEQKFVDVIVGNGPGPPGPPIPPVPPDPTVPPDKFDNVGQQAHTWAMSLFDAKARALGVSVARTYSDVAEGLEKGTIPTISKAAEEVGKRNKVLFAGDSKLEDQYTLWARRVGDVWSKYWPMDRTNVVAFFRAISAGLSAVK